MHVMNEPHRLLVSAPLLDERGKACPAPIIALAMGLKAHLEVELWADDPAAEADLNAFIDATGHKLMKVDVAGLLRAIVRRRR
jgi:TusA-related sulfurtransferase